VRFPSDLILAEMTHDPQSERQGTLDGNVVRQPRVPAFSMAGLLDYIVELVVCEDDVRFEFLFKFLATQHENRPFSLSTKVHSGAC
jgi:hypothetical protein